MGKVVSPGVIRNSVISRFSNDTMNANSAPATIPGRIAGSVTRRSTAKGRAPRLAAASSAERSRFVRAATHRRMTQGVVMRTWASTSSHSDPDTGMAVCSSTATAKINTPSPIAMPGTVSGANSTVLMMRRPRNRLRTSPIAAGMPTARLPSTEQAASFRLVESAAPNFGMIAAYHESV
jgi:hypothetical protein